MKLIVILIICLAQLQYCYDIAASGTVDLNKDAGWSQIGAVCVGYIEERNFSTAGTAAGSIDVELTNPINAPNTTEYYVFVMYDDQNGSFPKVNNSNLTCEEKDGHNYYRLAENTKLQPNVTFARTIKIHQHLKTRWWYLYLINCDTSVTFAPIEYAYSYKDNKNDTQLCPNPSNITTTYALIMSGKINKTSYTWVIVIVSLCIIGVIVLGLVLCRIYFKKRSCLPSVNADYNEPLIHQTGGNITENVIASNNIIDNDKLHGVDIITNIVRHHDDNEMVQYINEYTQGETKTNYNIDENITIASPDMNNIELIQSENNVNYFVGQRVLIEVEKLLNVEATITDITDNGQFIVVRYDNYSKGTETLHVINDQHRIKPLESMNNESEQHVKTDENDLNINDEIEHSVAENESNECIICMDKPPRYACIPCGHYGVCINCKDIIKNQCPICMAKCSVVKIFKS